MIFRPFLNKYRMFSITLLIAVLVYVGFGQAPAEPKFRTQEFSEIDGYPVLMKHLPDFDNVKSSAKFAITIDELRAAIGDRSVLANIDLTAGAEAVTAPYAAGLLLIIEYSSPQASIEADEQFKSRLSSSPNTAYRRIGNYNAFVFDASDQVAANALLDQVLYEKEIQWLGDNPFRISAERAFVIQTSELFVSTVIWIFMGIGLAVVVGIATGAVFFGIRRKERNENVAFANVSGMTILELDEFSSSVRSDRSLGK